MHATGEGALNWDREKCELCYQCEEICPLECIDFAGEGKTFRYEDERCWRCGRCTRVCPGEALRQEGADDELFMRSLAEAAGAVLSTFGKGKVLYVNFLTEIQPECDCMPGADVPVVQEQGILVSDDVVAVEQASMDMLGEAAALPQSEAADKGVEGGQDVLRALHRKPAEVQVRAAEELGLGARDYELVEM
jgi:uncharacterized Fe-S center protein